MKFLIVGLGNIGAQYTYTRHNIGFEVLNSLATQQEQLFKEERLGAIAKCTYKGRRLHLLKPNTYMNHSGRALRYWLQTLNIPLERMLVVVDDINLPFGKLRLRPKGGDSGHNGLKDIVQAIGTTKYARLRFGVGSDFLPGQQANYVLNTFPQAQQESLAQHIHLATKIVCAFCYQGMQNAMNTYNEMKIESTL